MLAIEIRRLIEVSPLAGEAERLMSWVQPSVRLQAYLREEDNMPRGASRFGGCPDLPPQVAWPCRDDRPLAFLAQIDLAEAARTYALPELPHEGWIAVFYDPQSGDEWDRAGWQVMYYCGESLALRRVGHPDGPEAEYNLCDLAFAREDCLPDPSQDMAGFDAWVRENWDAYWDLWKQPQLNRRETIHRLGGYPSLVQGGMEGEARDDWAFFLQIDTDAEAGWMWGDAGQLYFYWDRTAPMPQALANAWCITECY